MELNVKRQLISFGVFAALQSTAGLPIAED
jgi:hypothetical protein